MWTDLKKMYHLWCVSTCSIWFIYPDRHVHRVIPSLSCKPLSFSLQTEKFWIPIWIHKVTHSLRYFYFQQYQLLHSLVQENFRGQINYILAPHLQKGFPSSFCLPAQSFRPPSSSLLSFSFAQHLSLPPLGSSPAWQQHMCEHQEKGWWAGKETPLELCSDQLEQVNELLAVVFILSQAWGSWIEFWFLLQ